MKPADAPSSNIVRLPLEVLEIFIQYSPLSTQLALARVSKLFHSLSLHPLYCNISLSSPRNVVACCRTLLASPSAAKVVRSFMISYTYYSTSSNTLLAAYYSVIKGALLALTGLHTLKLLVHDPYFVTLLKNRIFPALRQFECYLTPSIALIGFLNSHPKVNYLQLSPNENTSGEFLDEDNKLPPVELPRLQYFAGNAQSIPCLGTSSTLRAAIISWNIMDTDPDLPLSALQRSSHATLSLLSCRRRGWNLDLIEMISNHLPDIHSLHISNVLLVDGHPTEHYLQTIRSILQRFTQLHRFKIHCIDYWEMGNIACRLDEDFTTVTCWGDACPSLTEISLPHSEDLSWYRISENVWIPDPKHKAGAAWLSDAVTSKRHHKWGVIAEGLETNILNTTAAPTDFVDTIANARSHLEDLLRSDNRLNSPNSEGSRGSSSKEGK
ncbi:hypothetical protein BDN70DRAFT_862077 [Pholiota conissans]|uniref:F-box domain-containing protein n=1 Tax=Pholiota conissans TaxID=109636 RepID=A0A9P5YY17_9AGAR|nr:hypothetical protein BDN70DRAFT_862077 [Pholiota conissans]